MIQNCHAQLLSRGVCALCATVCVCVFIDNVRLEESAIEIPARVPKAAGLPARELRSDMFLRSHISTSHADSKERWKLQFSRVVIHALSYKKTFCFRSLSLEPVDQNSTMSFVEVAIVFPLLVLVLMLLFVIF